MSFLYPQFLWALAAIAIPIIIHFFNFRTHKVVYFSNVAFLKKIEKQTKSKSKLKQILILITRILIIIALVLTFAQPFINKTNVNNIKKDVIAIYMDNSFSMNSEGKSGKLINEAKNKAYEIIKSYPATSKFLFLNNNFENTHQHLYNKEIIQDFILETKVNANVKTFSSVYSKISELLETKNNENNYFLYYITDLQKNIIDFENIEIDSNLNLFILPLATQRTNNLYIDSIYFQTPYRSYQKEENIFVQITNNSNESYQDMPVRLFINDTLKALASYNIDAESSKTIELTYTNSNKGAYNGRLEITDYPIIYDNKFYFSYTIAKQIKILVINHSQNNKYFNTFFENDNNFQITNCSENNVPVSQFYNFHLIILAETQTLSSGQIQGLQNYISKGGTVVFFPNLDGDVKSYNSFFNSINANKIIGKDTNKIFISKINQKNIIYKDVFQPIRQNTDYPQINQHYVFEQNTFVPEDILLSSENGRGILKSLQYKKGKIYIFSIPINKKAGNFATHKLFSPTIYNISIYSQLSNKLFYEIGKDEVIEFNNMKNSEYIRIVENKGNYDFIPYIIYNENDNMKFDLRKNKLIAGNYTIFNKEKKIKIISFNNNRKESELNYFETSEIKELIKKYTSKNSDSKIEIITTNTKLLEKKIKKINKGKELWQIFIVLALFFLLVEIIIIRFFK